jgi:16S rRNA (cytosine967-C5)-methyltransferase
VPWTKSPEDIARLAEVQSRLLAAAIKLVKRGGRVVFSNCSLDPQEGEELFRAFLAGDHGVTPDPIRPDEIPGLGTFITPDGLLRTTPADLEAGKASLSGLDGFFAGRLCRL